MKMRPAHVVAVVSVIGLMAWIFLSRPTGSGPDAPEPSVDGALVLQNRTEGSMVPCAVPLRWRIARVDEGFGLGEERARAAVEAAARLWEDAAGRDLFARAPDGGFPVRFVYDERQERTVERVRRGAELEREARRLEDREAALDSLVRHHAALSSRYERRLRDFQRRAEAHNMTVRSWDQRGGAPPVVRKELAAAGDSLEAERRALTGREGELAALEARIRREEERLRRRAEEHARRGEALERDFRPVRVESGVYREAVGREGERMTSIRREIRIYRYDDPGDLELVIAHELGHALGLGHADTPGAVMSPEHGGTALPAEGEEMRTARTELRPADLEMLRTRCPGLR